MALDTKPPVEYYDLIISGGKPGTSVEFNLVDSYFADSNSRQHIIDAEADIQNANKLFDEQGKIIIKFINNCGMDSHKGTWFKYRVDYPYKNQSSYVTLRWQ